MVVDYRWLPLLALVSFPVTASLSGSRTQLISLFLEVTNSVM